MVFRSNHYIGAGEFSSSTEVSNYIKITMKLCTYVSKIGRGLFNVTFISNATRKYYTSSYTESITIPLSTSTGLSIAPVNPGFITGFTDAEGCFFFFYKLEI